MAADAQDGSIRRSPVCYVRLRSPRQQGPMPRMWNGDQVKRRDKRMIRRLFTTVSLLSLVLCVTAAVFWVRSYRRYDSVGSPRFYDTSYEISSGRGGISISVVTWLTPMVDPGWSTSTQVISSGEAMPWSANALGFCSGQTINWSMSGQTPFAAERYTVVPHWLLFLLTGVLPALWVVRFKRHRRCDSRSYCITCGYDLRASTGRCPECGTPIPSAAEATM